MNNTTRTTITVAMLAGMVALWPAQAQAATDWMPTPYAKDSIPVYDRTGRSATMTAVDRWEHTGDGYDLWRTLSQPPAGTGVVIQWDSTLAGTNIAGLAEQRIVGGKIVNCLLRVNTNINGIGRPSGKLYEAIISHEFGHCMGLKHDDSSTQSIMRPGLGADAYVPTTTDKARARAGMATN